MSIDFQSSLLDVLSEDGPVLGPLGPSVRRHQLGSGAWVDVRPTWLSGADELFARLVRDVPWHAERRQMYDRVVDVPRLLKFYDEHEAWPDPTIVQARDALNGHYADGHEESAAPFTTAGMCFYRDGRDSVAWHGDTVLRDSSAQAMVAILSLGEARRLSLRPRAGSDGTSVSFAVGHGDLLVMGGTCQRTWEHAVLKTARPVGPRISIQFRPRHVR